MLPQQLIDRRFLEEMKKDGTFERLGLKKTVQSSKLKRFKVFGPLPNLELGTLNLELLVLHYCKARPTTFAGFRVHTV